MAGAGAVSLIPDPRRFCYRAVEALAQAGWTLTTIPVGGRLAMNRNKLVLPGPNGVSRFRLLIFSITGSSRERPEERRIEITSTYFGGSLNREPGFQDVVLGYERAADVFVGFDPRRLHHGGVTANASSFLDVEGIRLAPEDDVLVLDRQSGVFGPERHAFFQPIRIAEYLFNADLIHQGLYGGGGLFSGPVRKRRVRTLDVPDREVRDDRLVMLPPRTVRARRPTVTKRDVEAGERGDLDRTRTRRLTPAQFEEIRRRCEENGQLGEQEVLRRERRRLRRAGRKDLASSVEWTSRTTVSAGYDIRSYESDGAPRYIEVKTSVGSGRSFQITRNEWETARRLKNRYVIARVASIHDNPEIEWFRDPVKLEAQGKIQLEADGWIIKCA